MKSAVAMEHQETQQKQPLLSHNTSTNYDSIKLEQIQLNSECTDSISLPDSNDYQKHAHSIASCDAVKRIVTLLNLYEKNENMETIYKHMMSTNYHIASLMQDWYEVKIYHLRNVEKDIEKDIKNDADWLMSHIHIRCADEKKCEHFRRYQRDREKETAEIQEEIDLKHFILKDQIHSIHSFIFHPISTANVINENDEQNELKCGEYIWDNCPQSIDKCTVKQIICILETVIIDIDKLREYKDNIICYLRDLNIDGNKLSKMDRKKEFINAIANHLNNNKLRGHLGKLHHNIIHFNLSEFTVKEQTETSDCLTQESNILPQKCNSKFITEMNGSILEESVSKYYYYSFGTQFKYTENLSDHPLHLKPRFKDLKKELIQYFMTVNEANDLPRLLQTQLDEIKSMNVVLYPVLKHFLLKKNRNVDVSSLWTADTEQKYNETILVSTLVNSCNQLVAVINRLCCHLKDNQRINQTSLDSMYSIIQLKKSLEQYLSKTNKRDHLSRLIHDYNINHSERNAKLLTNSILKVYYDMFPTKETLLNFFSPTSKNSSKLNHNKIMQKYLDVNNIQDTIMDNSNKYMIKINCNKYDKLTLVVEVFYQIMRVSISKYYTLNKRKLNHVEDVLMQFFIGNHNESEICDRFTDSAKDTIHTLLILNKHNYLEIQQQKRLAPYIEKCNIKMRMKSVKRLKASFYQGINKDHQIYPEQPIQDTHVLSLVMYAQCSKLCTAFRETYRLINEDDGEIEEQKKRHSLFWHLGKYVYESFVFYASIDSKVQKLYHGMGLRLLFKTMYCTFDAPTSTTTQDSVALSFGENGIMIKFESCDSTKYIKTLDMSLFTCYDHEEEHLIFETRLHINDIWIPNDRLWIGKQLMRSLSLYDLLVHGHTVHNQQLLKSKVQNRLLEIIKSTMDGTVTTYTKSNYVNSLIKSLMEKNTKIWLNIEQIKKLTNKNLQKMFISDNNEEFGVLMQYVKKQFNAHMCRMFITHWKMNSSTFEFVSRASNNVNNINHVILGPIIECSLFDNISIVFQPKLTKIKDVFYAEMKFIATHNELPIMVHFNVESKESNNYYTSLHPRRMDVKINNTFHVELPSSSRTLKPQQPMLLCCNGYEGEESDGLSLSVSIMIHNMEHFHEYQQNVTTSNMMIHADMMAPTQSYMLPDILSTFYGVSNSIISILDSITDCLFLIFLLSCNSIHHNESSKDQHITKVINLLTALCVANLISIAIIIAFYFVQKISFTSLWKSGLLAILFIILSPFLPALTWILEMFVRHKTDVLIMSTDCDGLLIWCQQELIRNKLFIVEALFESCFQVIIQIICLFTLQDYLHSYIYAFSSTSLSIGLSLLVIISKFPLLSYNQSRIIIFYNILSYSMDVYFSLLLSIFMGGLIFQQIFTFIGMYMILELLICVPFYSFCISYLHFSPRRSRILSIPFLVVFCYPLAMWSLSFFSTYPLLLYLVTQPHEIGKKLQFHKELYNYCCKSEDEREFEMKLVIINYVCIKSSFERLQASEDMEYYAFAHKLYSTPESKLNQITLKSLRNVWSFNKWRLPWILIPMKRIQCPIRFICIILFGLLDIFWLHTFQTDSVFMGLYGNIIVPFCAIGVVVFLLWISFGVYQIFVSKWYKFCHYMHASKHSSFVLLSTVKEFKTECDKILKQNISSNTYTNQKPISTIEIISETFTIHTQNYNDRLQEKSWFDDDNSKHLWYSILIQSAIIAVLSIESNNGLSRKVMMIYSIIVICVLLGFIIILTKKQFAIHWKNLFFIGVPLTIFSAEIAMYIYLCYFYEIPSSITTEWIAIAFLIFIGLIMCIFKRVIYFIFILKDVVVIAFNEIYSCNGKMIKGRLDLIDLSLNVNEWLLFGTVVHILWMWKKDSFACLKYSLWCFFFMWIVIGFVSWNEMRINDSINTQCEDAVLLWCSLQTIEFCVEFCILMSDRFVLD
eukprot:461367_1